MSFSEFKMAEDKRGEVGSARDRFSGALSSAVVKVESVKADGESQSYFLGTPVKRHLSLDSPWSSPTKSPRSNRRRRKKEIPQDSAFHHTFVMKLFDRSLDLAQFPSDTSLYPVCRAWMKNQPHNTNMAPRIRTPTPEPTTDDNDPDSKSNDEKNDDDSTENVEDEPEQKRPKIYRLPPCTPLPIDDDGEEMKLRIPGPLSVQKSENLDISQAMNDPPPVNLLLNEHMERWTMVRKRWKEAYAVNEERYSDSLDLLKTMFQN